ncbi:hypothetical protein OXX79_013881 [Metschnikowia pulcherrima]
MSPKPTTKNVPATSVASSAETKSPVSSAESLSENTLSAESGTESTATTTVSTDAGETTSVQTASSIVTKQSASISSALKETTVTLVTEIVSSASTGAPVTTTETVVCHRGNCVTVSASSGNVSPTPSSLNVPGVSTFTGSVTSSVDASNSALPRPSSISIMEGGASKRHVAMLFVATPLFAMLF